jgi:TonB family protein
MIAFESFVLSYLLNALWQVPVFVIAAWIACRLLRRFSTALEHRIWIAALFLSAIVPACNVNLVALAHRLGWTHHELHKQSISVTVTTGSASAVDGLSRHWPQIALALYFLVTLYVVVQLVIGLWRTHRLRTQAHPAALSPETTALWRRCLTSFQLSSIPVLESESIDGPVTLGFAHPCLLLPMGWSRSVEQEDLASAFAHECAHIARRDFAKNLFYTLITVPIAFHPFLRAIRTHLVETREMLCDEAASHAIAGKHHYAKSLLRLASLLATAPRSQPAHAIGIFDANNLEKRIMNLTSKSTSITTTRKLLTAAACLTLGIGTCASALALHMNVTTPATSAQDATVGSAADKNMKVSAGVMAGQVETKVNPIYPPDARAAKIQGAVLLRAIIGKNGEIEQLRVIEGPKELQRSALDAVRQWKYKPFLLNGNPTAVETTITVNYALQN